MNVAQAFVAVLERAGARRVYGLIGTSILDFVDALKDSDLRYLSTRHDQAAVAMAAGEGKVTGHPGVAAVHGGPGFLNALTAFAGAYKDSVPLVMISGAVKRRLRGLDSWLEVPQRRMIEPVAKAAFGVERPQDAGRILQEAFDLAGTPPAGPVFVEVAEDGWHFEAGDTGSPARGPPRPAHVADESLALVAERLRSAERPVVLAGGGINTPAGAAALRRLAEGAGLPVATTGNGRGALPEAHALCLGRVGFGGGNTMADRALERSDFVLALGAGLSDVSTYAYASVPRGEVVAITLDSTAGQKPVPYSAVLQGEAVSAAERLASQVSPAHARADWSRELETYRGDWRALCDQAASTTYDTFVNPSRFFRELDPRLPDDLILSAGQGFHVLYAYAFLTMRMPASFLAATNLGAMGFAFPAALGAKVACPEREVVAVLGDGEFLMTLPDLETAVREKIGVKIVVVNDNSYRVLLMRQKIQKDGRVYGTTHTNPDIEKLGEAFRLETMSVDRDADIPAALDFLGRRRVGPCLVELRVSPEDVPPFNLEASLRF